MSHCKSILAHAIAIASITAVPAAHAFKFNTGDEDLKLRWDNTLKYSAAARVKDRHPRIIADRNADDVEHIARYRRAPWHMVMEWRKDAHPA